MTLRPLSLVAGLIALVVLLAAGTLWSRRPAVSDIYDVSGCGGSLSRLTSSVFKVEPQTYEGWREKFDETLSRLRGGPHRFVMLGDSITDVWPPDLWETVFPNGSGINLGFSGDRIGNLLWRLEHGHATARPGTSFIILIGTNDVTHQQCPEDIARGVARVIKMIRAATPQSRVLVLGLLPRGADRRDVMRQGVELTNAKLRSLADPPAVTYAEIGDVLIDGEGRLDPAISPDVLHFTHEGYQRLVPRMIELVQSLDAGAGGPKP
jgi:lysophospholipase L1-like esterase